MREYVSDRKLLSILNAYSVKDSGAAESELGAALLKAFQNTEAGNMIVPVLGVQGMGKSTLINSILGKNILPNDVDETTCVPVEVCYGEKEYAEVLFKDAAREKQIVHTREELNAFVDNAENPANRKGVAKIILYDALPLLKSGMVIVDLPGVGSLTTENGEVTKNYIKNLCTAIFVIPTSPTIRKTEALFIKSVWSQFPTAVFVQNHWGESRREVDESIEYNTKILKKIAREIHAEFHNIIVVDAYHALCGAMNHDTQMMEQANLPALHRELERFADNWKENMQRNLLSRLRLSIQFVKQRIQNQLEELQLSQEEIEQKRDRQLEIYEQQFSEMKKQIREIENELESYRDIVQQEAAEKASACVSKIRADLNRLIDSGITDGEQLCDAFRDYQNNYMTDTLNEMFDLFQRIKGYLDQKMQSLADYELQNGMQCGTVAVESADAFKFEKSFGTLGVIGGSIAATFITLTGPLGLIVGLAVVGVGALIGGIAKHLVQIKRKEAARRLLEDAYKEIRKKIADTINTEYHNIQNRIAGALTELKAAHSAELNRMQEQLYDETSFDEENRMKMERDLQYLEQILGELNENG